MSSYTRLVNYSILVTMVFITISGSLFAQGTRLLQQPSISSSHISFVYGGDIWITNLAGGTSTRITSTPAVESNPHISPDGKYIAFSSNRSGNTAVYIVSVSGGTPTRLTWHPANAIVRGWSGDNENVIFATTRDSAPANTYFLWSVSRSGGPAKKLVAQWSFDGSISPDGKKIILDKMTRWESEFRAYRGGQNTPLILLNLEDNSEVLLPNESTIDIQPRWIGDKIYFLSDRDWTMNIWSYDPASKELKQLTNYTGSDIKSLNGSGSNLVFEREGYLHLLDLKNGSTKQLDISVVGDFPWAETKWKDVSENVRAASLSPSGQRALMEARGEIFTVPSEHGDTRNLTLSSEAADHSPIWSPLGNDIAWFSDAGGNGYSLKIAEQDGLSSPRTISIGESKMAWEPTWSPDGKYIAFTDDDVRIRIVDVSAGSVKTIDSGGTNLERGSLGLTWSPDSKWLAYSKVGDNNFSRVMIWSTTTNMVAPVTNELADSFSPAWDRNGKHLYFLASTDLGLSSSWANTSAMTSNPNYSVYLINLKKEDPSPFALRSDEESKTAEDKEAAAEKDSKKKKSKKDEVNENEDKGTLAVEIDFDGIERRTIPLPMPNRNYRLVIGGPEGSVFIGEAIANSRGLTLHKFTLKDREAKEYASGLSQISISADGTKMLARTGNNWKLMDTSGPSGKDAKGLNVTLSMKLDYTAEWKQMFEEAWRYERDYFYDPNMHGRDWNLVHQRYTPLIPYIKHRADLTYILDQMNGELSVGHSFVFGGDYPEVESGAVGLLGADLVSNNGAWQIIRIYTTESWNPGLSSPLDQPGIKVAEGNYLVGINGKELTATQNPYELLDGTAGVQTIIHLNTSPSFAGSWRETIEPIRSENALRQRAWVEDNRRLVDELSAGKVAYVWVPNTGGSGFVSFNRYYFAQQDKEGAVIDERFNGGGSLDDYMVDLMKRSLRAALTNEVPNGKPIKLPAGILGPKVLLINEKAGSGGDFFPWAFRQQNIGPLIGARTWGGLVKSSVHYPLVDGGALTAPDNAVFDPINNKWVAENEGVAPDIAVRQDAKSLAEGKDPQLERAVQEVLRLLEAQGKINVTYPPYSTPAIKKN